uniref:Uncharacterized protein LOC114334138 n=1 Tax=Diabrotica virgifera virgifera TaxID=50390 RepID=A0A6P7G4Q9_DIAVI
MENLNEIESAANDALARLGPSKSGIKYRLAYKHFQEWCDTRGVRQITEDVLLAYFNIMENENKWKSSTMWSRYSMIKSELVIRKNVDISKFLKLRAFLKKTSEGYTAKKSKVFTKDEFDKFLFEAPDKLYLGLKVKKIILQSM